MAGELLDVKGLHAIVEETEILRGVDLTVKAGEVHAIMGLNGAGNPPSLPSSWATRTTKSRGSVHYDGQDLTELEVHERARAGLFLSFQYPHAIPGVQVGTFLRKSVAAVRGEAPKARAFRQELKAAMDVLNMDRSFLSRYVNDGFSGARKSGWRSSKCCSSSHGWPSWTKLIPDWTLTR